MKFTKFFAVAAIAAAVSCNPSYRATDTPGTGTDSTMNQSGMPDSASAGINVSPTTQSAFQAQYPNATNVAWSRYDVNGTAPIDWDMAGWTALDQDDYVVTFNMDNEDYYAWYDSDGNWIGSASALKDHSKLPPAVSSLITSKYADYKIENINREFQKDRVAYEIEMEKEGGKAKLLVDSDGNILKEKVKVK